MPENAFAEWINNLMVSFTKNQNLLQAEKRIRSATSPSFSS